MCVFCKIIQGEIPCKKIYEDQDTLAFLDIACDSVGHTLVIPKKHCTNLLDVEPETLSKVMNTVALVSRHYVNNCGFDGVNLLNANGLSAHQSVFHLHFHIIPRKDNDGKHLWPLENVKEEMDLNEICEALKIK